MKRNPASLKNKIPASPMNEADLTEEAIKTQRRNFKTMNVYRSYEDETWSAYLIDKPSLAQYNNNYKFILTVIDIFTKYAWGLHH